MVESRALQEPLFLVAHAALDPALAPFPYPHGDGDGLICVCPIGGESASATHHGVDGDESANDHDDSGDGDGLDCALTGIALCEKID